MRSSPSNHAMECSAETTHEHVERDFTDMRKRCTVQGTCGRQFILVEKLTNWMKEPDPGCHAHDIRTGCLLQFAYPKRQDPGWMIEPEHIAYGGQCALLTFCILLELGLGDLIHTFHSNKLVDKKLPIDLYQLRKTLGYIRGEGNNISKETNDLAVCFDKKQWRYCAARFDLHMGLNHVKHEILPICVKEKINKKGATADLWYIEVHQEFVGKELRDAVPNSRFKPEGPDGELGHRYAFALKSFREGFKDIYENEKKALKALQRNDGMVKYLGHYGHKEVKVTERNSRALDQAEGNEEVATHNILLEYAEFDLAEYFAQRLPPVFPTEIEAFWKALFEVADALEGIHNLENNDGAVKQFDGWHADIKPDNILSVQGKFKLADPGFAIFVPRSEAEPKEVVIGGTKTFGAPECHHLRRGTFVPVTQRIDVWSLGCVFSLAATWMTLGWQGLPQFEKLRQKAGKKSQLSQQSEKSETDYFHDGKTVLPDVTAWHKVLRSALRKTDSITGQVLDLVDEKMLLGAEERIKAKELCAELKKIAMACEAEPRDELPESIKKVLLEVDDTAKSKLENPSSETLKGSGQALTNGQDRQTRKSYLRELPLMKTAHRSEYKSVLNIHRSRINVDHVVDSYSTDSNVLQSRHAMPQMLRSPPILPSVEESSIHANTSIPESSQAGNHHRKKSRIHAPQTIAQAQEEMRSQKNWFLGRTKKDKRLTDYFEKRDLKFLVDNGSSMVGFWDEATVALDVLIKKAAGQDKDGVDLSFTCGGSKLTNQKGSSKIMSAMNQARPDGPMGTNMGTNMGKALGTILSDYLSALEVAKAHKRKGLTLIVLTDGRWEGMANKAGVEDKVVHFLEKLGDLTGHIKDRLASIEFIQFGHDQDATHRLRHLDGELKWRGVPDIIDTEHVSGDVYKMLLGSLDEGYDSEEDETSIPSTPVKRQDSAPIMARTSSPEEMSYGGPQSTGPYSPPSRKPTQPTVYPSAAPGQQYSSLNGFTR